MDQDLLERRKEYAQISRELLERASHLKQMRKDCEQARKKQVAAEVALKKLELERASQNQAIAEERDELYSGSQVTSARDVMRIEERIQERENRVARIDERIEPIKEQANTEREKYQNLSAQLAEMETDWQDQKNIGVEEQTRMSEDYSLALELRNEAAKNIPSEQLSEYNRLFKINRGKAVAKVYREICSGCSERLSVGELSKLKQSQDPVLCHCGKYLITLETG